MTREEIIILVGFGLILLLGVLAVIFRGSAFAVFGIS